MQTLTCGFIRVSGQQLSGPFQLEVVGGDMFTITAVQHLLISILFLHVLERDQPLDKCQRCGCFLA